jgi:hypothetical protein
MPGEEVIAALAASSIAAGVELIKAVGGALTAGRSVIIEIDNNTSLTLDRFTDNHDSGGFAVPPPLTIHPMTAVVFGSQSKGGAIGTGTVGSISYTGGGVGMLVGWNNAFGGDNKTNVGSDNNGLDGPNATRFLVIHQTGVGNQNAQMRFMLFPHPPYSLRRVLAARPDNFERVSLVLSGEQGFRKSFPTVTNIRQILDVPGTIDATSFDAT